VKAQYSSKKYTPTEIYRELLSSIETCKEYKNILLGYHVSIIVFTYHKNNTFNGLKANASGCVLRWLVLLEEYGVTFEYLTRKKKLLRMLYPILKLMAWRFKTTKKTNFGTLADTLSHHDIDSLKIKKKKYLTLLTGLENSNISNIKVNIPMHTSLIFKEQKYVKNIRLWENASAKL
jgi:hypothetical protein